MNVMYGMKTTMEKHAKGKWIVVSLVLLLPFLFLMKRVEGDYLDGRFGYNSNDAYELIDHLGDVGQKSYLDFLGLDDGIILFFSIVLLLVMGVLSKKLKLGDKWAFIYALPLLRATCDLFENVLITILLYKYPSRLDAVADLSGLATGLKWIFMMTTIALIACLSCMVLWKAISRKKTIGSH